MHILDNANAIFLSFNHMLVVSSRACFVQKLASRWKIYIFCEWKEQAFFNKRKTRGKTHLNSEKGSFTRHTPQNWEHWSYIQIVCIKNKKGRIRKWKRKEVWILKNSNLKEQLRSLLITFSDLEMYVKKFLKFLNVCVLFCILIFVH